MAWQSVQMCSDVTEVERSFPVVVRFGPLTLDESKSTASGNAESPECEGFFFLVVLYCAIKIGCRTRVSGHLNDLLGVAFEAERDMVK